MKKMRHVVCTGLALVLAAVLAGCGSQGVRAQRPAQPTDRSGDGEARQAALAEPLTSFRTSDGFTIAADLDVPGGAAAPLVVLGHQVGRDRRSWDVLVPRLLDAGYAVIRVDHRSFGESTLEVESPARLTNGQKWGLYLDLAEAIDAAAERPGVDASRVAVVGTGLSVTAAVQAWEARPEVQALVLMSGVIQKEQVLNLMSRPDVPLLLVAASGNATDRNVMRRYEGRFLGPAQRYIEFDPLHEDDPANWQGTDGLNDETGLPDLILWFLQENLPAR